MGWSFSVSDSAIDHLKAGETKFQLYDVTIDDGRGGTIKQTVTIKLAGADDVGPELNDWNLGGGNAAWHRGQRYDPWSRW